MRFIKWFLGILLALFVLAFLHYTLPQTDIVRIVGTENRRIDFGENSWFWAAPDVGTAATGSRDVFFINAVYPDGDTMEYRNEDTGWGWPPYFKMNNSSLQTEAKDLISTKEKPIWVAVTHYGWRLPILSIYPNAVSVREATGPDEQIIPYVPIVVIAFLIFIVVMIRRMWAQFWERSVEPMAAEVGETWDGVEARATGVFGRIKAWFKPGPAKR